MDKRIFIAVDVSEAAREKIGACTKSLRNEFGEVRAGWERAEKLHLTLKFLGDTNEKQLREVKTIVARIAENCREFTIKLDRSGVFPNRRSFFNSPPRVLWIGVADEEGNLTKISRELENECANLGFNKETRPFHPHLTIARIREPQTQAAHLLAAKHLETQIEPLEIKIAEIVIYESELQKSGSVFKKLQISKLKN